MTEVEPAGEPTGDARPARRRRSFLITAVASTLVVGGGLGAAPLVRSSAQRAADTAPPPSTLLTAQVTRQVLTPTTVTRGLVYPATRYDVSPTPAGPDITRLYLSRLAVKPGDQAAAGTLLAEISGQPLFVLDGAVPAYRDLKPGLTGPDVSQLQAALEKSGFSRGGDPDGTFGPGTGRAVDDLYRGLGYPAPTTGPATQQAVDAARRAVEDDRRTIDGLQAQPAPTIGRPIGPAPDQLLAAARRRLAEDQAALDRAEAVNGPMVPAGEVIFLPGLPVTVTAVHAAVGAQLSGPLLELAGGGLAATGRLTPTQAEGIKPGMVVEILAESTGQTVKGTVADLGPPTTAPPAGQVVAIGGSPVPTAATTSSADAQPYVPLRIRPVEPLPAELSGQNVRITVFRGDVLDPVLTVPVAAVATDPHGRTTVTRVAPDGHRTTVPIATGVNTGGYVGVSPLDGAQLAPGDEVVVGR